MTLSAFVVVLGLLSIAQGAQTSSSQPSPGSIKVTVREALSGIPVDAAEVTIERLDGTKLTAETDAAGIAAISELLPGRYDVRVVHRNEQEVSSSRTAQLGFDETRRVVVKPGAATTAEFVIEHPAIVRGQVMTAEGRPVIGAPVAVLPVLQNFRGRPVLSPGPNFSPQARTDAEGRFVVVGLRPARYFVRVELPPVDGTRMNYVYAPGVLSTDAATPFALESGDDVIIGITAPSAPTVILNGRVVDSAGHPVDDAHVSIRALDQATKDSNVPATSSDRDGRFQFRDVRVGTYALQATRLPRGNEPVTFVGATELEVREKPVDQFEMKLVPGAVVFGRMLFNGVERPDPGRHEIRLKPEGDDAYLREGLSIAQDWNADGAFSISGVVGTQRLILQANSNWFIERAVLEDGTELAGRAFAFEPGRVYKNVRVLMSDETAEITGKFPKDWEASPVMVLAFPEDASLWQDDRYIRFAMAMGSAQTELTINGIPPGRNYLVAIYVLSPRRDDQAEALATPLEVLDRLAPVAARVFVGEPGRFTVDLRDPRR